MTLLGNFRTRACKIVKSVPVLAIALAMFASPAVHAWGLELVCEEPQEYSNSCTAVFMPQGHDADQLRAVILENFDMSLGAGLSKLAGKVFRIGHLGSFNDLMLAGTLSGIEMGLQLAGVPHKKGGVAAALDHLAKTAPKAGVTTAAR